MSAMKCEEVQSLSPEERQALFHGRHNLWGTHGMKGVHLTVQPPQRRFVLRGNLVHDGGVATGVTLCHVGVGKAHARIVSESNAPFGLVQPVWGIGGVVTIAGQEGRGHASRLLSYVLEQLRAEVGHTSRKPEDRAPHYAMLFCLEHRRTFYANRGWLPVEGHVTVEQDRVGMTEVRPPYYVKYVPLTPTLPVAEVHLWSRPW